MSTETTTQKFRRHVNAAWVTGHRAISRNLTAAEENIRNHAERAEEILRTDAHAATNPLCDYLDSPRGRRLAEKWAWVERRAAGLPTT